MRVNVSAMLATMSTPLELVALKPVVISMVPTVVALGNDFQTSPSVARLVVPVRTADALGDAMSLSWKSRKRQRSRARSFCLRSYDKVAITCLRTVTASLICNALNMDIIFLWRQILQWTWMFRPPVSIWCTCSDKIPKVNVFRRPLGNRNVW